jgi:group I intron endonuclease
MKIGVYKIKNLKNGKFYIGSSRDMDLRFKSHIYRLKANSHHCKHLQASFNKHGVDAFDFEIVEIADSIEDAMLHEEKLLNEFHGTQMCYNSSPLAIGHLNCEHVRNLSVAGMLASEHYKKVHSDVCKKRNADPEFKRRLKDAINKSSKHKEAVRKNASTHLQTEEAKQKSWETRIKNGKQRLAAITVASTVLQDPQVRAKSLLSTSKRVKGTNIKTGEVLYFESQSAAARFVGAKYATGISQCCTGKNAFAHGYTWEFDATSQTSQ